MSSSGWITAESLPIEITQSKIPVFDGEPAMSYNSMHKEPDLKIAASEAEYKTIINVLKQVNYNKTKAAEILKIDRKTLYNKIKGYEAQRQVEE